MKARTQKIESIEFPVAVLIDDIDKGDCKKANKCMIRVAVERTLRDLDGAPNHHTRVDAGHITFHWKGYRFSADTPKIGKASLIKFDKEDKARRKAQRSGEEFESKVSPFKMKLKAHKVAKLPKNTAERREQINKARRKRVAAGHKQNTYTLRDRIVGFA